MIWLHALLAQASGEFIRWSWIASNADKIWERTVEHLLLTGIAIGAGFLISLVLSVVALRVRRTYAPITRAAAIVYTIPSIALFPALIPWFGIDILTASIGLTLYTLLMFVRNIVAGLQGVPSDIVDAARGMGYTRRRLFLEIELPLAIPVIIAGFRIATVTTVGLVTITGLFGLGGLGFFIFDGMIKNLFITELLVGSVGALVLALVFDALFVALGALLTPWSRRAEAAA